MPTIKPVSDLRDYNKVLKECKCGEPVFLTKNGHGLFVVIDIRDFEKHKDQLDVISNGFVKNSGKIFP